MTRIMAPRLHFAGKSVTIIGTPAEVKSASKRFRKGGYANVKMTRHPTGALILHLRKGA